MLVRLGLRSGRATVRVTVRGADAARLHWRSGPADVQPDRHAAMRRPTGRPAARWSRDGHRGPARDPLATDAGARRLAFAGAAGAGSVVAAARYAVAVGPIAGPPVAWDVARRAGLAAVDATASPTVGAAMLAHRDAARAASIRARAAALRADAMPDREPDGRGPAPAPVVRRRRT